jgi:amidase
VDTRDLWKLDATAQAALVRNRQVTPAELLEAAIARIERLNPQINAVITPLYDRARDRATAVTAAAPFAGLPMLVKDACLQIEGTPYYVGTQILRDVGHVSGHTTELAKRFERAGFTIMAKTNVPCMSSGITTEPVAFGAAHNPWDMARTTGGSSGGSAAAVACGMTAIAHGSDAGGSLRYPAACCGVVTLKPTRGRVPSETPTGEPDIDGAWSEFVLARSVRDLAGVLDAAGGVSPAHEHSIAPPLRSYVDEIADERLTPLRVGLLTKDVMSGMPVEAECVAAVEAGGKMLASLGHHVEEAHPAALDGLIVRIFPSLNTIIAESRPRTARWLEEIAGRPLREGDIEPELLTAASEGTRVTAAQREGAQARVDAELAPLGAWWEQYDVLVTPTLRQPPWPVGQTGGAMDAGTFPFLWSMTGQPAMSLPMHWTPSGLPVGVQIVGAPGRDDLLLSVAAQLEAAQPWADRWPTLALA